jgi:ribose/xylose/arabinose/galactoside ABC-type transport system permease subunit
MVQRVLITLGVVLLLMGLLWPWIQKMGLGRLPGDLVIERENFRLYFPLATSIIISLIVTLLFWLFRR